MIFLRLCVIVALCAALLASTHALPNERRQAESESRASADCAASSSAKTSSGHHHHGGHSAGKHPSATTEGSDELLEAPEGSVARRFDINNAKLSKDWRLPADTYNPKATLITCMDTRILPEAAFGLKAGEVKVLRSAGGRVPDLLRSIHLAQHVLGAKEIILMHHTKCGLLNASDADFRKTIVDEVGPQAKPFADVMTYFPFTDLRQSVHDDIALLKNDPLVDTSLVTGWIHDVDSGDVTRVA